MIKNRAGGAFMLQLQYKHKENVGMKNQPQHQGVSMSGSPMMQPKKKSKTTLWALVMLIIGLAVGAGAIYVWQSYEVSHLKDEIKTEQEKVQQLEKQKAEAKKPVEQESEDFEISDKEKLSVLTVRQVTDSTVGDYYAPIIHNIYENYAYTSPLPVTYSSEQGYEIPAMGGVSYYWHKKDDTWQKIGYCTESGCEMEEGYTYEGLPKELTE